VSYYRYPLIGFWSPVYVAGGRCLFSAQNEHSNKFLVLKIIYAKNYYYLEYLILFAAIIKVSKQFFRAEKREK
jgi:hypothetical protein